MDSVESDKLLCLPGTPNDNIRLLLQQRDLHTLRRYIHGKGWIFWILNTSISAPTLILLMPKTYMYICMCRNAINLERHARMYARKMIKFTSQSVWLPNLKGRPKQCSKHIIRNFSPDSGIIAVCQNHCLVL